jgi:membrane protein YqaA with SNARE-associated domain
LRSFIASLYAFALSLGGPGLFAVAALDSSFVSLPQINDLLVVAMVLDQPALMPYYVAMATLGSVVGCFVIYVLANKGGEALLRRRLSSGRVDRALGLYRKYGVLALMVPALLPPPAPFKLFVLGAGVAGVRPLKFVLGIAIARALRYGILGILTIYYGQQAVQLMQTNGPAVGLALAGLIVVGAVAWILWRRRQRAAHA